MLVDKQKLYFWCTITNTHTGWMTTLPLARVLPYNKWYLLHNPFIWDLGCNQKPNGQQMGGASYTM